MKLSQKGNRKWRREERRYNTEAKRRWVTHDRTRWKREAQDELSA